MAERLTVHQNGQAIYDIVFEDSFDSLGKELADLGVSGRRMCIVTDSTVAGLYLEQVKDILGLCCREVCVFVFPAGEESKTLDTVQKLYETLIKNHFDRKDWLAALTLTLAVSPAESLGTRASETCTTAFICTTPSMTATGMEGVT